MDAIDECPDCQADKKKKALAKKRRLRATEIRVTVARLTEENERYRKALEPFASGRFPSTEDFQRAAAAIAKREEQG